MRERLSELDQPLGAQLLAKAGKNGRLLLLDVVLHRVDELLECASNPASPGVHAGQLLEHLLGLDVLGLAVLDLLGLACLVASGRVDLGLLSPAVRDEQRGDGRQDQGRYPALA